MKTRYDIWVHKRDYRNEIISSKLIQTNHVEENELLWLYEGFGNYTLVRVTKVGRRILFISKCEAERVGITINRSDEHFSYCYAYPEKIYF